MKTIEYFLMRHANYYDHENQYVTYNGVLQLKNSVDKLFTKLNEEFPQKKIRITHSILPRAKHTVLLINDMLSAKGIDVYMTSDPRLNSDKLEISDSYIEEIVSERDKKNEVSLILSHQPDIEFFCKKELENSEWIRMTIDLEEKTAQTSDENDDLPF